MPEDDFIELMEQDALWDGEMEAFDIGTEEVLLIKVDGEVHAYDGICPHQSISLVEGELENGVLTCRAHEWQFSAATGVGVNPTDTQLRTHDVRVDDNGFICVRLRPAAPRSAGERPTTGDQAEAEQSREVRSA